MDMSLIFFTYECWKGLSYSELFPYPYVLLHCLYIGNHRYDYA